MKINKNVETINLTESDLKRIVKKVLIEQVSPEELMNNLREMGDLQQDIAHKLKSKTPEDWWDIWRSLKWLGDWNYKNDPNIPYEEWNNKATKAAAALDISLDETEGSDFWRSNEKISKSLGPEYVKLLNAIKKMWDKLLMDIHFVPMNIRGYNEKPLSYLLNNPPSKRISGDNYTDKIPNDIKQLKDLLVKLDKLDFENTKQYKEANPTDSDKLLKAKQLLDKSGDHLKNIQSVTNEHNIRIKKNGKIINLTEGDLKRIVKKILSEQATAHEEYRVLNNVYFESNTTGTFTMDPQSTTFPKILDVNGSKDGIISPDGIPDFNELWQANGTDFGRGYRTGSTGKHNYTYKDNKIYIVPAEGNEGATCGEGGCFYILKYVLNPETGKYEKI